MLRLVESNTMQDGAAILWRENQSVNENAAATEAAAAQTVEATEAAAQIAPSVTAREPQLHDGSEGRQLVPAVIMRGHSGGNAWRLAVHEFSSRGGSSGGGSSSNSSSGGSSDKQSSAATGSRHGEQEIDRPELTLMATGGNDGTCKLWDLEFEGGCERRQLRGKRWDEQLRATR